MPPTCQLRRTFVLAALAVSFPLSAQAPGGAAPAITDPAAFLREVKRRIPLDAGIQPGYVCLLRETEVRLDSDGRPTSRTTREYEMYPSPAGGPPYKRLIARDGVPVPASELAENDRRRRAELDGRQHAIQAESDGDREKRLQHQADYRRDRQALVDEIFRLFDFQVVGRDTFAGRSAYVVRFTPRPGLTASTRMASVAQKFAGKAWVDEQDLQVVRVEARSTDDVDYGYGLFARIYKGTTVDWQRRKVDGNTWMPSRLEIDADARVLLFRRLAFQRITDYLDYRRVAGDGSAFNLPR